MTLNSGGAFFERPPGGRVLSVKAFKGVRRALFFIWRGFFSYDVHLSAAVRTLAQPRQQRCLYPGYREQSLLSRAGHCDWSNGEKESTVNRTAGARGAPGAVCNGDSLVTSALAPEGVQNPYPSPLLDPNRRFTYEEDRYPTAHRRRGDVRPLRVLNSSLLRKQAPAL